MTELAPCERELLRGYGRGNSLTQRAADGEQLTSAELYQLAQYVEQSSRVASKPLAEAIRYRAATGAADPECASD